jgi:putative oxidoreductase
MIVASWEASAKRKGGVMSGSVNVLSRALMAAVFIVYGYFKFIDVTSILNNPGTKRFMDLVAAGTPAPAWLGYLIAAIELLGGLAILIGFKTRWVALALAIWLVVATALGHPFWLMEGAARGANQAHFYKNVAMLGGFLLLAITGGGRYALDNRTSRA